MSADRENFDTVRQFLQEMGKYPLLSHPEALELSKTIQSCLMPLKGKKLSTPEEHRQFRQGLRAQEKLVRHNIRLVVSIAKKYQDNGVDFLDLIQEGCHGLQIASERFNPDFGYRFSTYATWWIRQSVTRAIGNSGRMIRLPIHTVEKLQKLRKARKELRDELGRNPTLEETATVLEITVDTLEKLIEAGRSTISLNHRLSWKDEETSEIGDLIADPTAEDALECSANEEVAERVKELLSRLSPADRLIIEQRYGFRDGEEHTLDEVASVLGLSRERIRQRQKKALRTLKVYSKWMVNDGALEPVREPKAKPKPEPESEPDLARPTTTPVMERQLVRKPPACKVYRPGDPDYPGLPVTSKPAVPDWRKVRPQDQEPEFLEVPPEPAEPARKAPTKEDRDREYREGLLAVLNTPGVWMYRRNVADLVRKSDSKLTSRDRCYKQLARLVDEGLVAGREFGTRGLYYGIPRPLVEGATVVECCGTPSQREVEVVRLIPHPQRPEETCLVIRRPDGTQTLSSADLLLYPDEIPGYLQQPVKPEEEQMTEKRSPELLRQAVLNAIEEMKESRNSLSQMQLCNSIGLNYNYIQDHEDVREIYLKAIEEIKKGQPKQPPRRTVRARKRYLETLDQLVQDGRPFLIADVIALCGCSTNFPYNHRDLLDLTKKAIAETAKKWAETAPPPEDSLNISITQSKQLKAEIEQLQAQVEQLSQVGKTVAELEDRNRELRQQLAEAQGSKYAAISVVSDSAPREFLLSEAQKWRQLAEQYYADYLAATENAEACFRIFNLYEESELPEQTGNTNNGEIVHAA